MPSTTESQRLIISRVPPRHVAMMGARNILGMRHLGHRNKSWPCTTALIAQFGLKAKSSNLPALIEELEASIKANLVQYNKTG